MFVHILSDRIKVSIECLCMSTFVSSSKVTVNLINKTQVNLLNHSNAFKSNPSSKPEI